MVHKTNKRGIKKDPSKPAASKEVLIRTREYSSTILREIQVALDHPLNDLTPQEVFKLKGCLKEKIKDLKKALKIFVKLL